MKRLLIRKWLSLILEPWLHGMFVTLVLGGLPVSAATTGPVANHFPRKITLQDGKMTAQIVAAPLRRVMEEVSKLSGAQVRWLSLDREEPVSVEFTDLPFSEALRRILGEKDFVLFYPSARERARLPQIWIYPRGQAGGQLVLTLPPGPEPEGETTPPAPSDPAPGVEQNLDSLIQTAMHDQDTSVRLDAITQLGGYAEEDQRVEPILSEVARSDSNPQMREAAAELLQNME